MYTAYLSAVTLNRTRCWLQIRPQVLELRIKILSSNFTCNRKHACQLSLHVSSRFSRSAYTLYLTSDDSVSPCFVIFCQVYRQCLVQSRFSGYRSFEVPFLTGQCAVVKGRFYVRYRIQLKCVSVCVCVCVCVCARIFGTLPISFQPFPFTCF